VPVLPQTLNHELSAIASIIRSWGSDTTMANHGQAVFLIADRLNTLHPLVANNPRAADVEIPLPDVSELAGALQVLAPECPKALGLASEGTPAAGSPWEAGRMGQGALPDFRRIASRLTGTSIAALEAFLRRRNHAGMPLGDGDLGDLRKALVERDAGELIDFIEPDRTLDDVIGLTGVKARLKQDLALWRQDETAALPMGYLFCGPVGTGKTYLAECLAGEAGVPVVVLRNFRDRWVGSTEANLEKIFALLHALGRCIVFVDEADQALGKRAAGSGDSGVSSRVYSMLAAEMSNTRNRGKILWVLASSRPDLIEVDLKRPGRIDVKVPIFPTATHEEGMILLGALCKRRGIPLDDAAKTALLPLVPKWLTPGAAEALAVKAYRLTKTGTPDPAAALRASLEGYLPPVDPAIIRAQMQLAAEEATDAEFVPQEVRAYLAEPRSGVALPGRDRVIHETGSTAAKLWRDPSRSRDALASVCSRRMDTNPATAHRAAPLHAFFASVLQRLLLGCAAYPPHAFPQARV
jgi:hypothetical protein